jgi:hypothetical protein
MVDMFRQDTFAQSLTTRTSMINVKKAIENYEELKNGNTI